MQKTLLIINSNVLLTIMERKVDLKAKFIILISGKQLLIT